MIRACMGVINSVTSKTLSLSYSSVCENSSMVDSSSEYGGQVKVKFTHSAMVKLCAMKRIILADYYL